MGFRDQSLVVGVYNGGLHVHVDGIFECFMSGRRRDLQLLRVYCDVAEHQRRACLYLHIVASANVRTPPPPFKSCIQGPINA